MLIELIKTHALTEAQASDWDAVAKILNAPRNIARQTKAYYVEVYLILGDADMRHTLRVMASDEIGQAGVARLNDPSSDGGLSFAHPITIGLIESLRSQLNTGVADKLLSLGVTETTLAKEAGLGELSPEECSAAYLIDTDVLMSINRPSGGDLRVMLNMTRNGQQVRVAMLTKQQGDAKNITLLESIDAAISEWLKGV